MIVVAIVGLLAALAIYGVRKYMTNAKSAEARNALGQISKGAQTAWDRDLMEGATLAPGASVGSSRKLCPAAAAVPTTVPAGEKYQSSEANWDTDGWNCLKFSMRGPQYYQYEYTVDGSVGFAAIARGDLDGDTENSTFQLDGDVVEGTLTVSPAINETNPDE
jgi:type IV pilus assembly protein PilA